MYVNSTPNAVNVPFKASETPEEGQYFIIDWTQNNPLQPQKGHPVVAAGLITKEDLQSIKDGKIIIETPRFGTKKRILLQVVKVETIG